MRAAMRQDPDVILVGEIRDSETLKTSLAAAETGHLVLSTLHTTDAAETVNRCIDLFPPFQQRQVRLSLAAALRGIVGQRLVRRAGDGGGQAEVLVEGIPKAGIHNGGRIAFGPDGMLYAGTGDASERGRAQDPASLGGKILRLQPDGGVPADNPFPGSPVWTLGHRNVQGLAWDDAGRMFASELGQNKVDEVNRIEKGANYGWPEVEGTGGGERFRDPLVTWPTSQASPSGAAIAGDTLYVAALRGERLWKVPLDGAGGTDEPAAVLVSADGRLRHVAVASDGALWVLTSNRDGRGDPAPDDDRVLRFPLA